jgi:hypothetical protein
MKAENRSLTIRVALARTRITSGWRYRCRYKNVLMSRSATVTKSVGKMRHRAPRKTHIVGGLGFDIRQIWPAPRHHIFHHRCDLPAHDFVDQTRLLKAGYRSRTSESSSRISGSSSSISNVIRPERKAIVDVVGVVGNVIGNGRDLGFKARMAARATDHDAVVLQDRFGHRLAVTGVAIVSGPLCLTRPSSISQLRLRPVKLRVALLELGDDPERLGIVVKPARIREQRPTAPPRRCGQTACVRNRAPAPRLRPDPRPA